VPKQADELMHDLLRSASEVLEEALDRCDGTEYDEDQILRLMLTMSGLRYVINSHLEGTTASGKNGLIYNFGRLRSANG
jgi:hypothetical protein